MSPGTDNNSCPSTREEIARFILENKDKVLAIARARLAEHARGAMDSEDVLSSVIRRVDRLAHHGRLQIKSPEDLWAVITTVAMHDATNKARLLERSRSMIADDPDFAAMMLSRVEACEADADADEMMLEMAASIRDAGARQMFLLRLRGASHRAIAGALGIGDAAGRQRWVTLSRDLVRRFGAHEGT